MTLTVRRPDFDFTASDPHWGDNLGAVTVINAASIIPTPIERYLIKVMRQARQQLDPVTDAELVETVELFNKQEGQHLKLHNALLTMLSTRYPRLREFEAAYAADLEGFLATEPLEWNLAYCEGFESTGCATASVFVDGVIAEICGDRGSAPMRLWEWHLAEEFEHRAVVHDVIDRLYGEDRGHELRVRGATFNRDHIARHTLAVTAYLMEVDHAGLGPDERAAAEQAVVEGGVAIGGAAGERMRWVFDPHYDPAGVAPPNRYEAALAYGAPG
jgi:predicted metal-dependent hydrolase